MQCSNRIGTDSIAACLVQYLDIAVQLGNAKLLLRQQQWLVVCIFSTIKLETV